MAMPVVVCVCMMQCASSRAACTALWMMKPARLIGYSLGATGLPSRSILTRFDAVTSSYQSPNGLMRKCRSGPGTRTVMWLKIVSFQPYQSNTRYAAASSRRSPHSTSLMCAGLPSARVSFVPIAFSSVRRQPAMPHPLPHERLHPVDCRRRNADLAAELAHRRDDRIDLEGPAPLEILEHRHLHAAELAREGEPLVQRHGHAAAERRGDRDTLEHHRPDQPDQRRIGVDVAHQGAGERRNRVVGRVADQLRPYVVADARRDRRLEPPGFERARDCPNPRGHAAVDLAED